MDGGGTKTGFVLLDADGFIVADQPHTVNRVIHDSEIVSRVPKRINDVFQVRESVMLTGYT